MHLTTGVTGTWDIRRCDQARLPCRLEAGEVSQVQVVKDRQGVGREEKGSRLT